MNETIKIRAGQGYLGEITQNHQVGADLSDMAIGPFATERIPFSTNDSEQVFFNSDTGSDTTGDGTRLNPYATYPKAALDVDDITKLMVTTLNVSTVSTVINKKFQVDPVAIYAVINSDVQAPINGFQLFVDIINLPSATDLIQNCWIYPKTGTSVDWQMGTFDKCLFGFVDPLLNIILRATHSNASKLTNCVFAETVNTWLQIENIPGDILAVNCIIPRTKSIIYDSHIAFQNCTCYPLTYKTFEYSGAGDGPRAFALENCIAGNNNYDLIDFIGADAQYFFKSLLIAKNGNKAINLDPAAKCLYYRSTIIGDVSISDSSVTTIQGNVFINTIIYGNVDIVCVGSPNALADFRSGNQSNIFTASGVLKGRAVYSVDPGFRDISSDDYMLAHKSEGYDYNSLMIGKALENYGQADVGPFPADYGAYDANYSALVEIRPWPFEFPKPLDTNAMSISEIAKQTFTTQTANGEIAQTNTPEATIQELAIIFGTFTSEQYADLLRLRDLSKNPIMEVNIFGVETGQNIITLSAATVIGEPILKIDEVDLTNFVGSSVVINGTKYFITGFFPDPEHCIFLTLRDSINAIYAIDQEFTLDKYSFELWNFKLENLPGQYPFAPSNEFISGVVMRFTRKKP